jgi:hypothetical protein
VPPGHTEIGNAITIGRNVIATGHEEHLIIQMNPAALDGQYSVETLAGTIFHEWLHRGGFTHDSPPDPYGTLIKEAGLCLARDRGGDPRASLRAEPAPKADARMAEPPFVD